MSTPTGTPDAGAEFDRAVEEGLAAGRGARWERLKRESGLWAGAAILLGFVGLAVGALVAYGGSIATIPQSVEFENSLAPPGPSAHHPFGVMAGLGIDVFRALVQATPFDLALVAGILGGAVAIGVAVGTYGGFRGGPVDWVATLAADILVSVPPFFLVLVLFIGVHLLILPTQYLLVFGLCFVFVLWPYYMRPVRARAQQVAREPYVEAARASGATGGRMVSAHILPNSLFPVFAQVPVDVYNIYFVLTVFEFIGCFGGGANGFYTAWNPFPTGVFPEWGFLLANGACYGYNPLVPLTNWWMYTFPAMFIVVFGIGVMLLCDGGERYLEVRRRA
ncbi:MAG TPA: ABC transporter permease subunit [Thermoplasmata archaeon]|nr:ABC transporter permease subunit [Thermoplasmata archaeon]